LTLLVVKVLGIEDKVVGGAVREAEAEDSQDGLLGVSRVRISGNL
jgi:hypothetical protein